MKRALLILAFVLSFVFRGGDVSSDVRESGSPEIASFCATEGSFSPAESSNYSAENYSYSSSSFRSAGQGRRVTSSFRSSTRIIKEGKVIDRFNFSTFRELYDEFYSGIYSSVRYIYSIRHLLI